MPTYFSDGFLQPLGAGTATPARDGDGFFVSYGQVEWADQIGVDHPGVLWETEREGAGPSEVLAVSNG